MNTSAIYGFVNTLNKLLEDEKPDYVAVAFDTAEPTFRHKLYKEYKATREVMPDDLIPQIGKIKEIVMAYNIPMLEMGGYEADDIIGTLVKIAEKEKVFSFIVTPDKDFMQLVDNHVRLYKPAKGSGTNRSYEMEIVGVEGVNERFGVQPEQITDLLALMGDKTDNVPGIYGIGEKTASGLIQEFKSLDNLYKNLDKITKPKLKESLIKHKDDAYLSKKLVTIDTNVPIKIDFHQLKAEEKNITLLEKIFTELEFKSLLKKLMGSTEHSINIKAVSVETKDEKPKISELENIHTFEHKYYTIKTDEDFKKLTEKLKSVDEFSFDTETTSEDALRSELVGMSFSYNESEAFYVPFLFKEKKGRELFDKQESKTSENLPEVSLENAIKEIKPVLESKSIRKIGQNIKYDILVMKNYGVDIENVGFDTMIAAYILRPESIYKMDYLAEVYLKYLCIPISDLIGSKKAGGQKTMDDVAYKTASDYAAEDADVTLRLYHRLEYELKKISLDNLCKEIEFPLVEVLADIEYTGVKLDEDFLKEMNKELSEIEKKLEQTIYKDAGCEFNINSPKKLSEILFEKLKLKPQKKTKKGAISTDTSVLEDLKHEHPIAVHLLDFRTISKLRSTYTEGLLRIINKKTGKVHTSFNQTIAATGRLTSTNPNLQNIPIRTDVGKKLRKAFIPDTKNGYILSADYSQIELRILASLSEDENMIKAFERKHDIHTETASKVFNVKMDKVDANMRRKAKEVNFGIIYGMHAYGLASRLDIDQNEAREIIRSYFDQYLRINEWLEKTKEFARKNGYTETLSGRRRYLPNINNKNSMARQRDERIAINMPIQGTAADMIKIAMINIFNEFKKEKLKSKMILQVHDELVFDVIKEEAEEVEKIVLNKMKRALKLNVPIDVDIGKGKSWFEAHN